jgi:1,4-alpha-glucan branching enzyme
MPRVNRTPSAKTTAIRVLAGLLCAFTLIAQASGQSARPGWGATVFRTAAESGVTFRVWAPNASTVQVATDFNGWNPLAPPLAREGATGVWSADYPGIPVGSAYKFILNGTEWKSDPRARRIDQTNHDNARVVEPATNPVGPDFFPVAEADRVIYELHPGTFVDPDPTDDRCGTLWDAISGLDHLVRLGVTTVELMPVCEFQTARSWGYNGAHPFAVEEDYGGPEALKAFVRAGHARGLMVLLDVVFNHWDAEGALWQFDGWTPSPEFGGIYFYSSRPADTTPWGPRPDYSRVEVRDYILENLAMWKEEFGLDGFRWDAPRFIVQTTPDDPAQSLPLPDGETLLSEALEWLDAQWPGTVNIAEDLGETELFDRHWDVGLPARLRTVLTSREGDNPMAEAAALLAGSPRRVVFSESHDTAGTLNGGKRFPAWMDPGDAGSRTARKKSMLAAALVFSMPGTPMILQGQEGLETRPFTDQDPVDWGRIQTEETNVLACYRDLIRLRRNLDGHSAGLQGEALEILRIDETAQVLAYRRKYTDTASNEVVVVAHFSDAPLTNYSLPFPADGDWMTIFNGDDPKYGADFAGAGPAGVTVRDSRAVIDIGPQTCLLFARATDADGDELPDWWERQQAGNLTDLAAAADPDGDGLTNAQEKAAGTRPLDAGSGLRCRIVGATLEWPAIVGKEYEVYASERLIDGFHLLTNRSAAVSGPLSIPLDRSGRASRFFRIKLR